MFELIDAFQKILQKITKDHTVDLATDHVSVKDRMNAIIEILEEKGSIDFMELFTGVVEKHYFIVSFLALLELMKLNLLRVVQSSQSGIIRLFYQ